MLKRIARLLPRAFSLDDASINRVTAKDLLIGLPLLWLISWPLHVLYVLLCPLFVLFELCESLGGLFILACAIVFQVTIYLILTDGASFWRVLLCAVSGLGLFGYFVLFPLYRRRRGRGGVRRGLANR